MVVLTNLFCTASISHLKNFSEIPMQTAAIIIITITERRTVSLLIPRDAALSSLIPCVMGKRSAAFCSAGGMTS